MPAPFPIILVATQIVLVADSMPKFDLKPTCRAAAESGLPGRDLESCLRDEQGAHDALEKDWTQYGSAERSRCIGLVSTGGAPSYVELQACLEMEKQAREIREKPNSEPVGRR